MAKGQAQVEAARRLAGRLNYLPIAAFGLWSVPAKLFWLLALGIVPWIEPVPGWRAALPWLAAALLVGAAALLLPRSFHRSRGWERRGTVYRWLGVELFRSIVANGDLVNRFVRARHRRYSVYGADIERLIPKSIWNERRHYAYLLWGFVTAWYALAIGWPAWAGWLAITNVGANLYPAMLQRYSRARVTRVAARGRRRPGFGRPLAEGAGLAG